MLLGFLKEKKERRKKEKKMIEFSKRKEPLIEADWFDWFDLI